jgi:hypothetical protein
LRQAEPTPELDDIQVAAGHVRRLSAALSPIAALLEWDQTIGGFDAVENIGDEVRRVVGERASGAGLLH